MISISPLSGYKNVTIFTFSNSISSSDPIINWGDNSANYSNTATHIYSSIGLYNAFGGSCSSTSAFQLSVYDGVYFSEKISVERNAVSSLVSCPYTFSINLSSSSEINTVILYASGSKSLPYQQDRNFWSHLNPEWEFTHNNVVISEIQMTGSPVYSGSHLIGYTACSSVEFKDDMPGNPVLFFTVQKSEKDIPVNSRIYSALTHSVCAVNPDKLFITADGINPINKIQWADLDTPYLISVGSSLISCTNILHYVSGNITGLNFPTECYGNSMSAMRYNVSPINLFDKDCFPTGGYTLSSLFYPSSALSPIQITNDLESCNYNFDKVEYSKTRKTPKNVVLSATGVFNYNGTTYNLNGTSEPFDILAFENRHSFYRKGEDQNLYEILKGSLPFELEEYNNFNSYLSAVAGPDDSLGKIYDKIHNFNKDHSDIEICSYEALINKSKQFDSEIDDFGLELPEEMRRIFNFATIPLQKLIGTRCVCNTNFVECKGCQGTNICTICKFDKRSNLGDAIILSDYISAGQTVLYRENGAKNFSFLVVQPQNFNVFTVNSLSAEPFLSKGVSNFCFYKWDQTSQNNPIQSVVNYKDPRNMLNPSLSSNSDWYNSNGIVEEMFNYILTKNLLT